MKVFLTSSVHQVFLSASQPQQGTHFGLRETIDRIPYEFNFQWDRGTSTHGGFYTVRIVGPQGSLAKRPVYHLEPFFIRAFSPGDPDEPDARIQFIVPGIAFDDSIGPTELGKASILIEKGAFISA